MRDLISPKCQEAARKVNTARSKLDEVRKHGEALPEELRQSRLRCARGEKGAEKERERLEIEIKKHADCMLLAEENLREASAGLDIVISEIHPQLTQQHDCAKSTVYSFELQKKLQFFRSLVFFVFHYEGTRHYPSGYTFSDPDVLVERIKSYFAQEIVGTQNFLAFFRDPDVRREVPRFLAEVSNELGLFSEQLTKKKDLVQLMVEHETRLKEFNPEALKELALQLSSDSNVEVLPTATPQPPAA